MMPGVAMLHTVMNYHLRKFVMKKDGGWKSREVPGCMCVQHIQSTSCVPGVVAGLGICRWTEQRAPNFLQLAL